MTTALRGDGRVNPIEKKSIRIESGGGPHDVRVIDMETGRNFANVVESIEWRMGANDLPKAVIKVLCAPVDLITEAQIRPSDRLVEMHHRIDELEAEIAELKRSQS